MLVPKVLKLILNQLAQYFPFLRYYLERDKKLNFLAQELVFDPDLFTPVRRKQAVRQLLERLANKLPMQQGELLDKLDAFARQPASPDKAYRFRISCRETLYGKRRSLSSTEAENILAVSGVKHCLQDHDRLDTEAVHLLRTTFLDKKADIVYTDHDYLEEDSGHCKPQFKPDWNPDWYLEQDYIGRAVFYRVGLLDEGESLIAFLQGLACGTCSANIIHIPNVLVHLPEMDYLPFAVLEPPKRELQDVPLVSLLIPTRDRLDLIQTCVESVLDKTAYPNYEIVIIDNQSQEEQTTLWFSKIVKDKRVKVIQYDQPFNYAAMNNFGVSQVEGKVIGLLNNDTEVINPEWLTEMVYHACRSEIGCVGAKLYYPDGRIQHAGVILGAGGGTAHSHRYFAGDAAGYMGRLRVVQNLSAVTGACLLVRRKIYEQVGGLDEEHLKIAWNDVDFCLKVQQAGYRNLWTPYAELYHHESVSRGRDRTPEQRQRYLAEKAVMQQRWGDELWQDSAYNPNLTNAREDFSLNMLHGLMK